MGRILVLEDEPLIAEMLATWLQELGYAAVGPAGSNATALLLLQQSEPTAAILDIQVSDGPCSPVASELNRRGIPFIFATGCDVSEIISGFEHVSAVSKPFDLDDLETNLRNLIPPQNSGDASSG